MWQAVPADVPGARRPESLPERLMNALPLLHAHACIQRATFVRWMADICFDVPGHTGFVARMTEMWGECSAMADLREERNLNLRMRAPAPAQLHHPPFIGGFPPMTAPVEALTPPSTARQRGLEK
uniref:Uncharacterized protein n=1 Tax=Pyrodinium bahamense TaxID=73915 RepID=A0A7S0FES8_9DINO